MVGSLLPLPPGEGRGEGSGKNRTETKLWPALRNQTLHGIKFRRQFLCGSYILDYAAVAARLTIEVDGESHYVGDGPARDAERDEWLVAQGWRVLRFTNSEIMGNLNGVLQVVGAALCGFPHPDPLPQGEGAAA